ncbi:glycosyltransferase family 4 protein [Halosimplex pelagicum]|uniref:Glycosyltransferase family 4 protein n=1 Tax=Halosimplex pelagicum TaxID=869886 RepID=A0A7D5P5B0_9EURY|nr:glycosyltransferase family 4 protein [Halosimplex pelagicum]QLH81257.1 glycosyltransferase family 4 protein [Halosimplex pelagicum]
MKVTLVSTPPDVTSGTGKYADQLADALETSVELDRVYLRTDSVDPIHFVRQAIAASATGADVIHVQFDYVLFGPRGLYTPLFFGLIRALANRDGSSIVVTVHEVLTPDLVAPPAARVKGAYVSGLNRILDGCSDRLVFLSDQARNRFSDDVRRSTATVLPHGVTRDVPVAPDPAAARAEFGYGPDDVVVVEPGYVSPRKGSETMLALAERCPDFEFLLAGGPPRDRHDQFVEDLRARAPANLTITGHLSDERFHAAFAGAALIVLPYRETTQTGIVNTVNQSGVFNWAMAHGAPVLASDCERFRAVADRWGTPALFDPTDVDAAATRVRDLVADEGRRAELRDACAAYLDANDLATVAERHVELYQEIAG